MSKSNPIKRNGQQIAVIVNPAAGQDRPFLKAINSVFQSAQADWELFVTKNTGDGAEYARESVSKGVDIVCVHGGDGTVMDVACGLVGSNIPMAIVPGGTGNVFAVELGIPRDLDEACALAVDPSRRIRKIDVGQYNEQCFLLRAGVGFEASVVEGTSRELKDRYGIFAYIMAGLQAMREPSINRYGVSIDGERQDIDCLGVMVANAGNVGLPGVALSRQVKIDDGLLDVFFIQKSNLGSLLSLAANMISGSHDENVLQHFTAREITIETEKPQPIQVDGDLIGNTPVNFTVIPQAIQVIVPATEDDLSVREVS